MDTHEAEQLARSLMDQHGLANWLFRFDRSIKRFGICRFPNRGKRGVISLSRPLVELNTVETVKDTILHEIAHAIVGGSAGHGSAWKFQARLLGARPVACQSLENVVQVETAWMGTCPDCGLKAYRRRAPILTAKYTHGKCKYAANRGHIRWTYNGHPIDSK